MSETEIQQGQSGDQKNESEYDGSFKIQYSQVEMRLDNEEQLELPFQK